jgi:hypothetical protein
MDRVNINGVNYYTDKDDFRILIEETLGNDFIEYIQALEDKSDFNKIKANTDLLAYESQLDEQSCLLNDTTSDIEDICNYIKDSKRLDKQEVIKRLYKIIDKINDII